MNLKVKPYPEISLFNKPFARSTLSIYPSFICRKLTNSIKEILGELIMNSEKIKFLTKNKTMTTVALILMLAFPAFAALSTANAHSPAWTIPTWAFISVQPNPVGVGQVAYINFWIDKVPATANGAYGDRWQGFTIKITKPDGTTQNLGPFKSDDVGGANAEFTPTQVGSYSIQFSFPGQTMTAGALNPNGQITNQQSIGDYYQPSTSKSVTLLAQANPVYVVPDNPLPDGYWQRPIFAENTPWYSISGNWLGGGLGGNAGCLYNATSNYAPFTTLPSTSHIVWTSPYAPGGLIGGEYGDNQVDSNFYSTAQYECKFAGITINGVLYHVIIPGSNVNQYGWVAQDLRTGKTLWTKDTNAWLRMGQIFDYVSPNQFGGIAYLWSVETTVAPNTGATFGMYDAMNGKWILNIVNATTPTWTYGPAGELLGYWIDSTTKTMNMWNSTLAILKGPSGTGDRLNWRWQPSQGASIAWKNGIEWSVPMVTNMTASNGTTVDIDKAYAESAGVGNPLLISRIGEVILVTNIAGPQTAFNQPGYIITEGYSPTTGKLLWGPLNQSQAPFCRLSQSSMGSGVWTIFEYESQSLTAYSTTTGQKLWGPISIAQSETPWGYYITQSIIAYDSVFISDFGGYVHCLDLKTGAIKWTWNTGSSGYETPYGRWTLANILTIADNKLVVMGGHLYSPPLFHGGRFYVINTTSGNLIWSAPSFAITNAGNGLVSDGYLVVPNAYDNQLYCYNKGQSATSITIQNDVISTGNAVLIKGTVSDQSPGDTCLGIPAAGTPAISDDSMTPWMEYLYMQHPMPTNATGVPVRLIAVDPNGNTQDIGTVTTNIKGNYFVSWTPPVSGLYTVTATFEGTNSYYKSDAQTAFVVSEAPSTSPAITPSIAPTIAPTVEPTATTSPSPVPNTGSALGTEVYIAIAAAAVIAVVVAAALLLRKRK
jgi:hypothetical protein